MIIRQVSDSLINYVKQNYKKNLNEVFATSGFSSGSAGRIYCSCVADVVRFFVRSPPYHLAAFLTAFSSPLEIQDRPTPSPGPNDLIIKVKSIPLNPVDCMQRETGFQVSRNPVVLGSDIAGIIVAFGTSVFNSSLKVGARVSAFAAAFWTEGIPDYGGMQQRVIVPAAHAVALPDSISFNEAALLTMSVSTAWMGWFTIGVPGTTSFTPTDKQGMLVWGGASSIGSAVVQSAKAMGYSVYATASAKHHEYLNSLGATRVFDYKAAGVEQQILDAAKEDVATLRTGYDAVGQLQSCLNVLKECKGDGVAKLAEALPMKEDSPTVDGVVTKFIERLLGIEEREEQYRFIFNEWLREKLATGEYIPSPKTRLVEGGLHAINEALDTLKQGLSGEKLVLEI